MLRGQGGRSRRAGTFLRWFPFGPGSLCRPPLAAWYWCADRRPVYLGAPPPGHIGPGRHGLGVVPVRGLGVGHGLGRVGRSVARVGYWLLVAGPAAIVDSRGVALGQADRGLGDR